MAPAQQKVHKGKGKMVPKEQNRLSFGVELEFLFYYKLEAPGGSKHDVFVSSGEDRSLPPAPVCPESQQEYYQARDWATELIDEAMLSVPGARVKQYHESHGRHGRHVIVERVPASADLHVFPISELNGWECKSDGSVHTDLNTPRGYECQAFEITSPALWDIPESYEHVHAVLSELNKRFRLRVNLLTGFHCHVGSGDEPEGKDKPQHHSLEVLKRAAALLWAADNFIAQVHPPERAINTWAKPIHITTRLAENVEERNFQIKGTSTIAIYEQPVAKVMPFKRNGLLQAEDLPSHMTYFPRPNDKFVPALRPGKLDEEAMKRAEVLDHECMIEKTTVDNPSIKIKTVSRGVQYISDTQRRGAVATLLRPAETRDFHRRPNYNFKNYLPISAFNREARSIGTVEFREAAGSLDPDWVNAWTSICVGIFRFSRKASAARYKAVIDRLAVAEAAATVGATQKYDVMSLFLDLGLSSEAYLIGRILSRDQQVRHWYPNRLGDGEGVDPGDEYVDLGEEEYTPPTPRATQAPAATWGTPTVVSSEFITTPITNDWATGARQKTPPTPPPGGW